MTTPAAAPKDAPGLEPPLLKTCVKCGSEKPACVNCVKYRCVCVYTPSARNLRPHQGAQARAAHRARRPCAVAARIAPGGAAAHPSAALALLGAAGSGDSSSSSASSSSVLPLLQPAMPLSPSTQAALLGSATHMQMAATAPLPPLPLPPLPPASLLPAVPLLAPAVPQHAACPLPPSLLGGGWRAESPRVRHTFGGESDPDAVARGICSAIRGLRAARAGGDTAHERSSGSAAGSVSSMGSPPLPPAVVAAASHSPLSPSLAADPRQIEAVLPQPAPDSLDNMLRAYFRYQYPSSGIVLEEFFWYRYRRNMLTPLIIYAMLAVATWNLATDEDEDEDQDQDLNQGDESGDSRGNKRYGAVHDVFYRVAKQFVEDAMDEAHLRSVQGLLVLANYEALVGRWGTMWNHTTMARRLAEGIIFRDADFPWLGVERRGDSSNGNNSGGGGGEQFDFEYQRVRRAYWHSLINDIWASVLMDKQIGGIDIALPPKPTHDFTYRNLRLLPLDGPPGYRVELGPGALQDPRLGSTAASGELFLLVGGINNAVFLFQHGGQAPQFETFIDYEMRLTGWYLGLPEDVRLDGATIARFTATAERADLGEVISTHIFWNFARLLLMRMGLVLSLGEDPSLLRNIYSTRAFYTTDSHALQFYQASMPILTPDKAASYDEWLFHFCRCMSLQSTQNVVNLLKLGEHHGVHPGHFGAGLSLPLVQVVSVSMGLVRSPDAQVVQIALDHLATVIRTLLRLKRWFNTALLLLHLFLAMQDPDLVLPASACTAAASASSSSSGGGGAAAAAAAEAPCPFPRAHLISELMRRLHMPFERFVKATIRAVRMSSPTRDRVDPCISPLLRHLPEQQHILAAAAEEAAAAQEPDWFKYAPSYLRSAWKRLARTHRAPA
ncbi:hypothetical protein H4R18_004781 [Coemansia javaensis]|uniref:Xylanolytic transcriptional activator regulatory domain-containing protein n=1 Tax=Coemansia javaensis TaxID=2761396 RepID=A0A9W8H3Z4_9FUNG|nr:hypothetical protein H4R18_004781 [Coemansia javaensis]